MRIHQRIFDSHQSLNYIEEEAERDPVQNCWFCDEKKSKNLKLPSKLTPLGERRAEEGEMEKQRRRRQRGVNGVAIEMVMECGRRVGSESGGCGREAENDGELGR